MQAPVISGPYSELASRLDIRQLDGDEVFALCPFHGDSDASLHFNLERGVWMCFGCGHGGSPKKLAKMLEQETGESVPYRIGSDSSAFARHIRDRLSRSNAVTTPQRPTPESYLRRYRCGDPCPYWTKERGFSCYAVQTFQLGHDPMSQSAVIPVRSVEGSITGIIQRSTKSDAKRRYTYPESFAKSRNLFGVHLLEPGQPVVVVEGSLDAVRVWEGLERTGVGVVAQLGSSLSKYQLALLRELEVPQVILFYDCDLAGARAEKVSQETISGMVVRSVGWDMNLYCREKEKNCGCPRIHGADPDAVSGEEARAMVLDARRISR